VSLGSLLIVPRDSGEGGPSDRGAIGWWKGRGPRRNSSDESDASSQTPPPPRFAWPPSPAIAEGGKHNSPFSRCAFCSRPELCQRFHETGLPKREAERRKAHTERPLRAIAALPLSGFVARAAFGGRARLPALYRGSRQSLSALAQSGPALHGSANGFNSVRHPGSELLADRRRGRPGGFPNRPQMELRTPSRAPLPTRINRPSPVDVPLERAGWSLLVRRVGWIQEIPEAHAISLMWRDSFLLFV
jgi:hypothetical protein